MGFYYIIQIKWSDETEWTWKNEKIFSNMFKALIELRRLRKKYPEEEYRLHKKIMGGK